MKYEVVHSVLMGAEKSFKQGQVVTPDQLTDAGFDVEFLLKNGAIEYLKGTGDAGPDGGGPDHPAADLSGGRPGVVREVTGPRFTEAAHGQPRAAADALPADGDAGGAARPNGGAGGKSRSGKS